MPEFHSSGGGAPKFIQTTEPALIESATWVHPGTGQVYECYDAGSGLAWHSVTGEETTEEVSTFSESNVSLTHNGTRVANEAIEIAATQSVGKWFGSGMSQSGQTGIVFNPNQDFSEVTAEVGNLTDGLSGIYLEDSGGTQLASATNGPYADGDTVTFSVSLSAGSDYRIYGDGSDYTMGYEFVNFPVSGTPADVVDNIGQGGDEWPTIGYLRFPGPDNGDTIVSLDAPSVTVRDWDLVTYSLTQDGGSIVVDVEDQNGNLLFPDIGMNFDISTLDPSLNPRFRIYLSKPDDTSNPTVDYLARRYLE